jgi:hypothetical protein
VTTLPDRIRYVDRANALVRRNQIARAKTTLGDAGGQSGPNREWPASQVRGKRLRLHATMVPLEHPLREPFARSVESSAAVHRSQRQEVLVTGK